MRLSYPNPSMLISHPSITIANDEVLRFQWITKCQSAIVQVYHLRYSHRYRCLGYYMFFWDWTTIHTYPLKTKLLAGDLSANELWLTTWDNTWFMTASKMRVFPKHTWDMKTPGWSQESTSVSWDHLSRGSWQSSVLKLWQIQHGVGQITGCDRDKGHGSERATEPLGHVGTFDVWSCNHICLEPCVFLSKKEGFGLRKPHTFSPVSTNIHH